MENSEKNKIKEVIGSVTRWLLLIMVFISVGISIFYNIELQEQVDKRDLIIEQLTQRDSILNKIMEIEYDSITKSITYSYIERNGKIMKYNELANELDKSNNDYYHVLNKHENLLSENIQNIENYKQLIKDYNILLNNHKDFQKKYNNLVNDYNKKMELTKESTNIYNQTIDSLSNYKLIVDLIHSRYFIDYRITNEGKYRKIRIQSEKLDSALILLPYFRDRIKKEKDVWKINTRK
jgi:tetratricopeptide (TPR) repeat protein